MEIKIKELNIPEIKRKRLEALVKKADQIRRITENIIDTNYEYVINYYSGGGRAVNVTGENKKDSCIRIQITPLDRETYDLLRDNGIAHYFRYGVGNVIDYKTTRERFETKLEEAIEKYKNEAKENRERAKEYLTGIGVFGGKDKNLSEFCIESAEWAEEKASRLSEILEESLNTPYADRPIRKFNPTLSEDEWESYKEKHLNQI